MDVYCINCVKFNLNSYYYYCIFFFRHNIGALYTINFAARAWENVTANTITRSWNRVDIFPSTLSTGTNLDSASEERELEMEIVNLIEQLPINDPLEVREFVNIDDEMSVRESASVDDIVEVMNEQEGGESEEGDRETEVKMNDVIVQVDNVVKYIQQTI